MNSKYKDVIERRIKHLSDLYNPEHDLFNDSVQMNLVDYVLLDIVDLLNERIIELENRCCDD